MISELDKNTALIIIDLQNIIIAMETIKPAKEVIEKTNLLINAFRAKSLPVVFVNVIIGGGPGRKLRKDEKEGPSLKALFESMEKDPSVLDHFISLDDRLLSQPEDVFITKRTWNAFYNTNLDQELKKRNITGIVLCGISTSIGVEGTARAAFELGYNTSFAIDAMTDTSGEAQARSIECIFPHIGESGSCEELIEILNTH